MDENCNEAEGGNMGVMEAWSGLIYVRYLQLDMLDMSSCELWKRHAAREKSPNSPSRLCTNEILPTLLLPRITVAQRFGDTPSMIKKIWIHAS